MRLSRQLSRTHTTRRCLTANSPLTSRAPLPGVTMNYRWRKVTLSVSFLRTILIPSCGCSRCYRQVARCSFSTIRNLPCGHGLRRRRSTSSEFCEGHRSLAITCRKRSWLQTREYSSHHDPSRTRHKSAQERPHCSSQHLVRLQSRSSSHRAITTQQLTPMLCVCIIDLCRAIVYWAACRSITSTTFTSPFSQPFSPERMPSYWTNSIRSHIDKR